MNNFGIIPHRSVNTSHCVKFYDTTWHDFILLPSFRVHISKISDPEYLFINVYEIVTSADFIPVASLHTTPWSGSKSPLIRFSNWSVFAVSGSDAIIYYRNIIRDLNSSSCLILFFILLLYLGGDKAFLTGRQHCMYLP